MKFFSFQQSGEVSRLTILDELSLGLYGKVRKIESSKVIKLVPISCKEGLPNRCQGKHRSVSSCQDCRDSVGLLNV